MCAIEPAAPGYRLSSRDEQQLFGAGLPRVTDVHQGEHGTCYLLAALQALALRAPERLVAGIRAHGVMADGRRLFWVRLFVPQATRTARIWLPRWFCVSDRLSVEGVHGALWVGLYEKALAKLHDATGLFDAAAGAGYLGISHGGLGQGIEALVGSHARRARRHGDAPLAHATLATFLDPREVGFVAFDGDLGETALPGGGLWTRWPGHPRGRVLIGTDGSSRIIVCQHAYAVLLVRPDGGLLLANPTGFNRVTGGENGEDEVHGPATFWLSGAHALALIGTVLAARLPRE